MGGKKFLDLSGEGVRGVASLMPHSPWWAKVSLSSLALIPQILIKFFLFSPQFSLIFVLILALRVAPGKALATPLGRGVSKSHRLVKGGVKKVFRDRN